MILPPGVTGFAHRSAPLLPTVEAASFKAAFFAAARECGGRVSGFEDACYPRSYHSGAIAVSGEDIEVLCNTHYPLVGLRSGREFIDLPVLAETLTTFGFVILPATELNAYPDAEALSSLGKGELDQLRYWRPERLGEVIFNEWD
jgi:hypothetical protein